MRDAVLAGPTPAEIVALVRLAEHGSGVPPHLTLPLISKGWIMITVDGTALLTLAGRVLVDQAETVDIERLAGVPANLATWGGTQVV
jgi:hypothetical protein